MPTYVYRCDACAHQFDAVQRMTADALTECPACRAPKLVKQIQAAGFALKGTGWYVTDFRDKGKKSPSTEGDSPTTSVSGSEVKAETKAESKTETKTDTKSETKPETKSESAKPAATGTAA
jgi:putative FmdB family regulatory protein